VTAREKLIAFVQGLGHGDELYVDQLIRLTGDDPAKTLATVTRPNHPGVALLRKLPR